MTIGRYPPPATSAVIDVEGYIKRRAYSLVGASIGSALNTSWFWDDFVTCNNSSSVPSNWQVSNTGTAAAALQAINDEGGGWSQISTGATASSRSDCLSNAPLVANTMTKPWYCAVRMKPTTAVTSATKIYAGLLDASVGTSAITAGYHGSLHATNYVVQYDGSETGSIINLAVAVDTTAHVFEMWGLGDSKLHCAIDFGSDLGGVTMATGIATSASGRREAVNGVDNVVRTVRFDWFAVMSKRT